MTNITVVKYGALVNLGNYENEKVELEAELEDGQDYQEVLEDLKLKVRSNLHSQQHYYDYCNRYNKAQRKLKDIEEKLQKAYDQWEETSNFLIVQGLKSEVPKFPIERQNLITAGLEEVEVELENDEDEPIF